ncbi:vascular endothelial growth factor receptor 1 isoform X2 [Megalopta genalis]
MKPNISSTTDQIIIKEGDPLRLQCSGNSGIFFTYPTDLPCDSYTIIYYTSYYEINKIQDEYGTYWYDFHRPNTAFGDTGWYGCSYHPILTTRHNYSDPEISLVYVYVESETTQFVEHASSHVLLTTVRENIVIPCRPTSPTAEVKLAKYRGYGNDYVIPRYTFDPKLGIILHNFEDDKFGEYICYMVPAQMVSYVIHFQEENRMPEPRIVNNTLVHVIMDETLYLRCTITIRRDQEHYDGSWIPKQLSDTAVTTWEHRRTIRDGITEIMAFLEITGVTYMDEGIYVCRVKDGIYERYSQTYVQIHETIDPFIKLTTRDPNRYYKRHIGDEVEWVVAIDAYPSPELKWTNTHGDEITTSSSTPEESKFSIDVTYGKQMLRIRRLDLNDIGIYSIQAKNQYKNESLNFTLDVLAEPKVYMSKSSSYYFPNQVIKVECYVRAFPKPNITWSYRKCLNYPSCDDGTLKYLTNSKENGTVTDLLSTVWTTIEMSGELTCRACNIVGCGNVTENVSVSDEVGEFGIIRTMDPVAEGDEWELICAASIRNYFDNFVWSSENGPIIQSDRVSIDRGTTQFAYRSILKIHNVKMEDSQLYICRVKSTGYLTRSTGYRLEVKVAWAPIIIDTNLKKGEIIIDVGTRGSQRLDIHCFADGMPKPSISWFKDGRRLLINNEKYKFSNSSQKLELEYPLEIDSGEYVCRAENRIGKAEVSQRITIKGLGVVSNRPEGLIILVVTLAVVVLILVIYVALKVRRDKINRRKLVEAALSHFEEGAVGSLNPDLTVDDQADLLPYDRQWEFPREKLKLGKCLGSGAFGVVLKAEAVGICKGESVSTVAVKMVRRGSNYLHISALASELKIMVHLGKHLNVVNLLGACTKNILKHELLVIVEFCRFGNLHNYLLRHRSSFINQIDPTTGKLDLSISSLTRTARPCSTNRVKSTELPSSVNINHNSDSHWVQCRATATDSQAVDVLANGPVVNNGPTQPGWSNCRGDYKDSNLKPICTEDLLSWAFQVARGMEYLSQRRILHGDLAARNILLADDNVVKICDFGLAKSMYKEEIYRKRSDCPLPIKWLAIETMRDRIFSTQSDVWSFGIVLWEFFTLAETPYPGVETEILYQKLIEGYRMEQPEYAIPEVYDIMCQCWKAKPALRPSFTELVDSVGNLLEDNVRAHYIELNAPYLDMNRALQKGGRNDYLTMTSAPDYVMLSSPTHDCANSPGSGITTNSGHLYTSPTNAEETSLMLNKDEEAPYPGPVNVHERGADLAENRGTVTNQVVHPDPSSDNCNPPRKLKLIDPSKKIDEVAEKRELGSNPTVEAGFARTIVSTRENYVNMRQQKSGMEKDLSEGCSNPNSMIVRN